MDQTQRQGEIEAVAALIGTTSGSLKQMDSDIIDQSTNLKASAKNWDPNKILKEHILNTGGDLGAVAPPPGAVPGIAPQQVPSPPPPPQEHVQPSPPSPVNTEQLNRIEHKVDVIMDALSQLTKHDEKWSKFIDRSLKNKVKQVTIKLDDSQIKK